MKKYCEIITVVLFCAVIAVCSVTFVILPDLDFSQQENRSLAQAPSFNVADFFSGRLAKEINLYFADQFPLRTQLVKLKSATELALFKAENNGVLYSENQLAVKNFDVCKNLRESVADTDYYFEESVKLQLENLNKVAAGFDTQFLSVIPPRTIDITDSAFNYNRPQGDLAFDLMEECLTDSGYISLLDDLRQRYDKGEYVYYRTDHHWTTLGAYYAYEEIMKALGKESSIIPEESFKIEQIHNFSGTTAAKGCFPAYQKDILEIWHLPDDDEYEIIADGAYLDSFYSREYLETSDKYSVFLDGTHNITQIKKKGGQDRETLLIAKDSFANCLIPFLAREFDIVAVNIHVFNDISALAEQYNAQKTLVVCNVENLITTVDLGKLK